jgi:hypothetical protein
MGKVLPVVEEGRTLLPAIDRPIDNTAMTAYLTCPREYYFSMVRHRRGKGRSPALVFGSAWHKAMEIHYRTGGDAKAVEEAVIMSWEGHDSADDYRTLNRVLLDYRAYVKQYGMPHLEGMKTLGYPEEPLVEVAANMTSDDLLHPWAGKLDRFLEDEGSLVYVEDHKTTSRLDKNYFKQFDLSQQMLGYTYLGQQLLPNRKVVGVRINLAHVLTGKTEFHRKLFTFSPERIRDWAANTNIWLQRLALDYEMAGDPERSHLAFPGHYGDNGCSRKFGMCQYHEVCSVTPRIREQVLVKEFPYIEPWNPLEADEPE